MKFISNLSLQWRNKLLPKSTAAIRRKTLPYHQASLVGVLANVNDEEDYLIIEKFVAGFKKDGKKVKILAFQNKPINTANSLKYNFFRIEDLKVNGKINSAEVDEFINTNFDYLYCLNTISSDVIDYIMLQSKAYCRIGYYIPGKEQCFELMINTPEDNLIALSEQLLHFTSIITNNEK